jgi:broad specificity phosphatase PhoE
MDSAGTRPPAAGAADGRSDAPGATALVLARHGESVGNLAAARAEQAGADELELATRDADTPLSDRGVEQAGALGAWLRTQARPDVVWCSPYVRARQTAELALTSADLGLAPRLDDRLRDRELGVLDRLTTTGVRRRFPEEDARRAGLGKLYYRPPGGESWADVALRLRSWFADVAPADGERLLVVTHDAVISLAVYVLTGLSEAEVLELGRHGVRNASVTTLVRERGAWRLVTFDDVDHVAASDAPVTRHPGAASRGR